TDSGPPSDLSRSRQAHLLAERGEARIVLVAQDEGVGEDVLDICFAVHKSPIEPLEGCFGVIAQRVYLGNLVGLGGCILFEQRLERRIGRVPIPTDLQCEGNRAVPLMSTGFLLCSDERSLGIASLDFNDSESVVVKLCERLQLDSPVDGL